MFKFKILNRSTKSKARIGTFTTPHGVIETPVFMPVGTVGAVKTMTPEDLEQVGAQIILGNTYHLYLRPGEKQIKLLGGLATFNKWNRPTLTDSGGYQVFSLGKGKNKAQSSNFKARTKSKFQSSKIVKDTEISDEGVTFYSHLDGSKHFFSPEKSIEIQEDLGADIIMAFDECAPASASRNEVEKALTRTNDWLTRCVRAKSRPDQALFPICQGGTYRDLREDSAKYVASLDLPGNAIGGVSVGESKEKIYQVTKWCADILPENKPKYLMGIGYPEDIAKVINLGIDMFDCVLPTRLARHGVVWVRSKQGIKLQGLDYKYKQVDLTKSPSKHDLSILDTSCKCYTCKTGFSRSYLHHLVGENEPLGIHLLTIHNLRFVFNMIEDIKAQIRSQKV